MSDPNVIAVTSNTLPPSTERIEALEDLADALEANRIAESTKKMYRSHLGRFTAWCRAHGFQALPAPPRAVRLFLADLAAQGKAMSTIQGHLSAIAMLHEAKGHVSPRDTPEVRGLLRGLKRTIGKPPVKKAHLTLAQVQELSRWFGDPSSYTRGMPKDAPWLPLLALRNRALFLVGFLGAFRRSELVGIDVEHLSWDRRGLEILIPRSKRDQEGHGARTPLRYAANRDLCATSAVLYWLQRSRLTSGPLFPAFDHEGNLGGRLHPRNVAKLVKRGVKHLGLDPKLYAGHSLRAGLVTEAARHGASPWEIMKRTHHKRVDTVDEYVRRGNLLEADSVTRMLDQGAEGMVEDPGVRTTGNPWADLGVPR